MTEKPVIKKTHENNSIIQKVIQFQRYAEGLDEPERPEEIQELLADIANHAEWVIEFIKRLEINASELKEKAAMFAKSAKTQDNKAKSYKEYLKQALKSGGYEQLAVGDLMLKLSKSVTYKPKAAPTEDDLINMTDFVETKFNWKKDPEALDYLEHKDKVERVFDWKEAMIKAEIKASQKVINSKKSNDIEKAAATKSLEKILPLMDEQHSFKLNVGVKKITK